MKHRIRYTEVLRVERSIIVEVEGETLDEALDLADEMDCPDDELPGWTEQISVQNAHVEPAK